MLFALCALAVGLSAVVAAGRRRAPQPIPVRVETRRVRRIVRR